MYSLRVFNGLEKTDSYVYMRDLIQKYRIEVENENIWDNTPVVFEVYTHKEIPGFGVYYEIPAGYSSYTYDPETTEIFYKDATWEWFLKFGLDQEQRRLLHDSNFSRKANDLINGKE